MDDVSLSNEEIKELSHLYTDMAQNKGNADTVQLASAKTVLALAELLARREGRF